MHQSEPDVAMIDVAIAVDAKMLPRDHAQALQDALLARLPWLAEDAGAGIHPLKVVAGAENLALLARRTRLLLRTQSKRFDAVCGLSGCELDIAGYSLRMGEVQKRELLPHSTMYAYRVASASENEVDFMRQFGLQLGALSIAGEQVCGLRQHIQSRGETIATFSMMLHGLNAQQSLRLQVQGVGSHRLLGCGLFVPHKSAAAVGS